MSHDSWRDDLKAFLDGELSAERDTELERHLHDCAPCCDELERLSELCWQVGQLAEPEPPPRLASQIMGEVRRRRAGRTGWVRRLLPAFSGLAVASALTLVVVFFGPWAHKSGTADPDAPAGYGGVFRESREHDGTGSGDGRPASSGSPGEALPAFPKRVIVREATLEILVPDAAAAEETVRAIGAELAGTAIAADTPGRSALALQVPPKCFQDALARVGGLGQVLLDEDQTRNVRAELVDNAVRIRDLKLLERDYAVELRKATTIREVVDLDRNIGRVREQAERLRERNEALLAQSEVGTILIDFRQPSEATREDVD